MKKNHQPNECDLDVEVKRVDIVEMFEKNKLVKIQGPMVRYSKLPFRVLCHEYGCDICYTPMILADCFHKSANARDSEFSTNANDRPLVVQFAANNAIDFAKAAQLVEPYSDGVNINCGCPQKWAMQEKLGAALINFPELICDMVKQKRNMCRNDKFTMSVKIRIHDELKQTVDLVRQIEASGADYIEIHGRTHKQKSASSKVNLDAIKLLREQVKIPVVENGDVFSLQQGLDYAAYTGVNGVMSARGLLRNPALFSGYDTLPLSCLLRFLELSSSIGGVPFATTHHHCMFMLQPVMKKHDLLEFSSITSISGIMQFLEERGLNN